MVSPLQRSTSAILGSPAAIWIASLHELQQGAGHFGRERSRSWTAARVSEHQIGVIEPETDIHTVEGAHAVVEKWRLPSEPIDVDGGGLVDFTSANATTLCRLLLASDQISTGFLPGKAFA